MKLNLSDGVKIRKYNEIKKSRKELCMSYIYKQKYNFNFVLLNYSNLVQYFIL